MTPAFQASCSGSLRNSGITSLANSSSESQMCSWLFLPAWLSRITWSICEVRNRRSFFADGFRRADQAAAQRRLLRFRIFALPLVVFVPHVDGARRRTLAVLRRAVEAQRELEEGGAVGARARLLVGLRAHEERHQRHVRIDLVVGELLQPLGDRVVIGVHPGVRGIRADELEAERAETVPAGALDGRKLRARHPQRRMRLLHRLRHHVAQGNVEILAVVLAAAVPKHREDGADGFLEHFLLGFHVAAERRQFGDRGALAHAELDSGRGSGDRAPRRARRRARDDWW